MKLKRKQRIMLIILSNGQYDLGNYKMSLLFEKSLKRFENWFVKYLQFFDGHSGEMRLVTRETRLVTRETRLVTRETRLVTRETRLVTRETRLVTRETRLVSRETSGVSRGGNLP